MLDKIIITNKDTNHAISKLPNSTSCRMNRISATLMKESTSELILPLKVLWQNSLETGIIPTLEIEGSYFHCSLGK